MNNGNSENSVKEVAPQVPAPRSADRINLAIHLRRYGQLVRQRWLILFVSTSVGLAAGLYLALTSPDLFRAVSVLGIAPRIQTSFTSQAQYQEVLDNYYLNQLEYMRSWAVVGKVEEKMRDHKTPSGLPPQHEIKALRGSGSFFQMVVESPDFDYARRYAELWAREFVNYKSELKNAAFERTARATRDEVIRYEDKLRTAREAIQEFKRKYNIGSVKETGAAAQGLLDQLLAEQTKYSTLRQLLENTSKEDIANGALMDKRLVAAEKGDAAKSPLATADTSDPMAKFNSGSKYRELKLQTRSKEAEYSLLGKDLRPKHPKMLGLREEIDRLNRDMQFELDLIEESRKALLDSYTRNERSYDPLIARQKQLVLDSSTTQHEFNKLEEEETMVKNTLDGLRKSLKDVELSLANIEEDLTISQAGAGVREPVGPHRPKIVLAGLLLGLGLGLALIYFLHRLDDRLDLAEDIERHLEEPVLGQLPLVDSRSAPEGPLLVTSLPQFHMFSESVRGVRSSVLLADRARSKQVLLVTSAVPGDGKTTFTVNFAITIALAGQRVLLVDADLRRGTAHTFFGHQREPGFANVLSGELHWDDVVKETPVKTLSLIGSGALPDNPAELLVSPIAAEFLREVREVFDYVVIDSPPLTSINDTFSLVNFVDGLLFVVRAGQTSMRFAQNALAAARHQDAPLLGIVLNGITSSNPYYYYQQYYHAYYSQGTSRRLEPAAELKPLKMPAPKQRRFQPRSIQAEARALAGEPVPTEESALEELARTEEFKSRRLSRKQASTNPSRPGLADQGSGDKQQAGPGETKAT